MVTYNDIESHFNEYLVTQSKHLFRISGIYVMFHKARGNLWRINTDLSIEDATRICRSLNDQISDFARVYVAEEAWSGLARPRYRNPRMISQITGNIGQLDTLDRIWAALDLMSNEEENSSRLIRRTKISKVYKTINLPTIPLGHTEDDIIGRLGTDLVPVKATKELNSVEDLILSMKKKGNSYTEIIKALDKELNKVASRSYVYNILKAHGLVKQAELQVGHES